MSTIERLMRVHHLQRKVERRAIRTLARALAYDSTPEIERQYKNARRHEITIRQIRRRIAEGE